MNIKTISVLLEMGVNLYKKEQRMKKMLKLKTEEEFFKNERDLIIQILLIDMEILQVRKNSFCVTDTDNYEFILEQYKRFCFGEITLEKMMDVVRTLRQDYFYYVIEKEATRFNDQNVCIINSLFEMKHKIQVKRAKYSRVIGSTVHLLAIEEQLLSIALQQLGNTRCIIA